LKDLSENTNLIKKKALELGFNKCGISKAEFQKEDARVFDSWLAADHHSGMKWIENHSEKRKNPQVLVENASSVISVILNYYNPEMQNDSSAPVISRYAYGKDYHNILKKKLKALFNFIKEIIPEAEGRYFVDSAPVLEHAFARNAGLGWIGKNSLLLNKEMGSYFFIGEIIIDQELNYESKEIQDFCGSCSLCVDECPTHAINSNRTVDAGKCISYLTIEHDGDIPNEFKNSFYNRVFGCDICQDVCPWNRRLNNHTIPEFNPLSELMEMSKQDWESMDEKKFNEIFEGSAVKRTGYMGLKRNISFLK
jgi:epoxyqueuosine reductase